MKRSSVLPPTYFSLALIVMILLHFLLPVVRIVPSPWNAIGVIFLPAGLLFLLTSDQSFHRAGTTVKPFVESTVLVTQGVFRYSRNPMYLGFSTLLAGAAFLLGSLMPFVVVLVFAILMDRLFVTAEEKMLADKFGQSYLDYKRRVRRWI
jgi:protein-S-isoprenylcysteine O-methyltransferase Ste14